VAGAADHRDGTEAQADPTSDINDVYAWTNSAKDTVYLAMTVGGTMAPAALSDKVLYVFHINRDSKPLNAPGEGTETNLICKFASATSAECWLGDGATGRYVKGDPSTAMTDPSGDLKVHAGMHADPFFFYLNGLNTAITTVQNAASTLQFYPSGCPKLNAATVSALQMQLTSGATNDFAMNNAQVIVVALKKAAIPGTGEHFSIWASTNKAM
jgi:hypothetical protein